TAARRAGGIPNAGMAAPAAAVVHNPRLAERSLQAHGDDARNDVGRPAGGKRHDQRDQPFGIGRLRELASERPSDGDHGGRKRMAPAYPRGPRDWASPKTHGCPAVAERPAASHTKMYSTQRLNSL